MAEHAHVLAVGGPGHDIDKIRRLGLAYSLIQVSERVVEAHRTDAVNHAVLDYRDIELILPTVRAWHAARPFDAVVSFTEYGLEPASLCARELGVAGDNLTAVRHTRDKAAMRELLAKANAHPVRHRICAEPADVIAFLDEVGGDVVIKPRAGGLSEGVSLVRAAADVPAGWARTRAFESGPVLAEEYLTGPEYSVEAISRTGRHEIVMITEKLTTGPPGFIELGHHQPATLEDGDRAAIERLVIDLLDLIDQQTGPTHTELRLTPDGPRLIESQTRAGGDQIWELCELVTGVDLITETLAALLGRPPATPVPQAAAAAIRFFAAENLTVGTVHGLDQAHTAPGVVRAVCTLEPGRVLGPLTSSISRQGYVLSVGDNAAEAIGRADAARNLVRVTPAT